MKTFITLSALALIGNTALAETFTYEEQIGSQDLDPNIGISDSRGDHDVLNSSIRVSLDDWYRGNHDVVHVPYNHKGGQMTFEGARFSSYDAASRSNHDLET